MTHTPAPPSSGNMRTSPTGPPAPAPNTPTPNTPTPWRRPRPSDDQLRLNVLVSLCLFLASVLTMALSGMTGIFAQAPDAWVSLLLLACSTLPLVLRFTHPWIALVVIALGFGLAGGLGVHEFTILQITLFLAIYSEGAWDPDRRRAAWTRAGVVLGMFVWLLVSLFQQSTDPEVLRDLPERSAGWSLSPLVALMLLQLLTNVIYFAAAWLFGDRSWRSARDRWALEDLARQLSAQRRHSEEQAVALERVRIARELHDAVAHHVSLIGVQAGAARLALGSRGADGVPVAEEALAQIEEESRTAVEDMHALLHTLRGGSGGGPSSPTATPGADPDPGAASGPTAAPDPTDEPDPADEPTASLGVQRLPELALASTAAGVPTTFTEIGEPRPLPPLVSLNLFRVAQEALTNVRRHDGPGTTADVRLRHGEGWVELEVANARPPRRLARPRAASSGLGLIGMRERVESDGGHFEAGPLSAGGWVVRSRVPLRGGGR